jgi:hypothetical protein
MATRKAKPKKNRRGLLGLTPGMLRVRRKQSMRKATKAGYKAPKKRTMNSGARSMARATTAGKAPAKNPLSKFGQRKLAAKQTLLNAKGTAKSYVRKGRSLARKTVKKAFPKPSTSFISAGVRGAVSPVKKKAVSLKNTNAVNIAQSRINDKRVGTFSAAHRKAISDGLKKWWASK